MSGPYAGNPAGPFSGTQTLPDDGDAEDVASVNVPFEGIIDDIAYLKTHAPQTQSLDVLVTSPAVWTVPDGVLSFDVEFWGGGGGGGGGGSGAGTPVSGGGGGGASLRQRRTILAADAPPGTLIDVTIGAGGAGGAVGVITTDGANGGGDTIVAINGGATLATAAGAGPGSLSSGATIIAGTEQLAPGGTPTKGHPTTPRYQFTHTSLARGPGHGGEGIGGEQFGGSNHVNVTRAGTTSLEGFSGGAGGDASLAKPSGGGGAGGPGGVGGNGGDGNSSATAGGAADNTGGGGGGGGGSKSGTGGAGGAGGSGFCRIIWTPQVTA